MSTLLFVDAGNLSSARRHAQPPMGSLVLPSVSETTPRWPTRYASRSGSALGEAIRGPGLHERRLELGGEPLHVRPCGQPPRQPAPHGLGGGLVIREQMRQLARPETSARGAPSPHRLVALAEYPPPQVLAGAAYLSGEERRPPVGRQLEQTRSEPADDLLVERRARTGHEQPGARALPVVPHRRRRLEREPVPQPRARRLDRALGLADRDLDQLPVLRDLLEEPPELGHVGRLTRPLPPPLGDGAGGGGERHVERGRRPRRLIAVERGAERGHGLDLAGAAHHGKANRDGQIATRRVRPGYDE